MMRSASFRATVVPRSSSKRSLPIYLMTFNEFSNFFNELDEEFNVVNSYRRVLEDWAHWAQEKMEPPCKSKIL